MSRRPRILLRFMLGGVLVLVLLSVVGLVLFKGTPAWYRPVAMAPSECESLARAAENKLIEAQNWAELLRADTVRQSHLRSRGVTSAPATRADDTYVIEFTQREIDALFEKWSHLYNWRAQWGRFLDSPRVILRDNRIILAAELKELGTIVSVQVLPRIDQDGELHIEMIRVMAGRLPLPAIVWSGWRKQLIDSLSRQLPGWQAEARIDPNGSANLPAMAATLSRLALAVGDERSVEPVLFLPLTDRGRTVPVRMTELSIEQDTLRMVVRPLTPIERDGLLNRLSERR